MKAPFVSAFALSASALLATFAHAQLGLSVDLRATSVNGLPLSGAQTPHLITGAQTGDVIGFDIYALVTGTNTNFVDDRLLILGGSFKSTGQVPANLLGNLDADLVRTQYDPDSGDPIFIGYDGPGSSIGNRVDLDGDSDIDIGNNDPTNASTHFAVHYNASTGNGGAAGLPIGARIGFGTFTVTSASAGSETMINFFGRDVNVASLYRQDGVSVTGPTLDSPPQNGIVVVGVPEPSALAVAGFCAIAGCARRRRKGKVV